MPSQLEFRETIQDFAGSIEAKTILNDICTEACAAHTRELAKFIADPKDPWVKKYKASVAASKETKGANSSKARTLSLLTLHVIYQSG